MKNILFVCTGNTCRSPMAEKIFNAICSNRKLPYTAKSAGICTVTGLPISANSFCVIKEMGVKDLSFASASIDDVSLSEIDYFGAMTDEHADVLAQVYGIDRNRIFVFNVADPYGGSLQRYEQCGNEILEKVEEFLEFLGEENDDN
ncbi:MAG: low molecular weight protein arginine phosphatase [Ruminococcus sp.]|nr:low molecular weight protein arginine phosphatase [Ruminococcus sp.]